MQKLVTLTFAHLLLSLLAFAYAEQPCGDGSCWDGEVQMRGEIIQRPATGTLGGPLGQATVSRTGPFWRITFQDPITRSSTVRGIADFLNNAEKRLGYCSVDSVETSSRKERVFLRLSFSEAGNVIGQPETLNHPLGRLFSACITRRSKNWRLPAAFFKAETTVVLPIDFARNESYSRSNTNSTGRQP